MTKSVCYKVVLRYRASMMTPIMLNVVCDTAMSAMAMALGATADKGPPMEINVSEVCDVDLIKEGG